MSNAPAVSIVPLNCIFFHRTPTLANYTRLPSVRSAILSAPWPVQAEGGGINGGVIAATTWIDGMTDVLQVMLLLATLIWTVVKIANALKEFHGEE